MAITLYRMVGQGMARSTHQPRRMGTNEMIPGHIQAAKIIPRADLGAGITEAC